MESGKYKIRSLNKGFGRDKGVKFNLIIGSAFIICGLILLIIGLINKL